MQFFAAESLSSIDFNNSFIRALMANSKDLLV